MIDAEEQEILKQKKDVGALNWSAYMNLAQINSWMDSMVSSYPDRLFHIRYGTSHEGRELRGLRLNIGGGTKRAIVFEGTMHAREWISAATVTWMLNELLTSTNAEVQQFAAAYEWIFLPVTNPDVKFVLTVFEHNFIKKLLPNAGLRLHMDQRQNVEEK